MTEPAFNPERFRKSFLLILVTVISVIFLAMIADFLVALLLAAIMAAMAHPIFSRLLRLFKNKRELASIATVVGTLLLLIIPMLGFVGLLATQAMYVTQAVRPTIENLVEEPTQLDQYLEGLPFYEKWSPYKDQIFAKAGELAGVTGTFLVDKLADATRGTALFFFMLFIMLYAMFFFLIDGRAALDKILYYVPLSSEQESQMLDRFVSVTRATIKGSIVIGLVQGTLAGLAFWVAGIEGWVFWGTIMAVLSIIPGVGTALVWIPAAIYLFAIGSTGSAIGLTVWCAGVVGTVDNFLRPRLIGKDTSMPDLLILLSTLGGIILFGVLGFIIGPIIAALFITVWEIYGVAFKDVLPPTPLRLPDQVAERAIE